MKCFYATVSAIAAGIMVSVLTTDVLAGSLTALSVITGFGALDYIINK
jgi:hypothetical protein